MRESGNESLPGFLSGKSRVHFTAEMYDQPPAMTNLQTTDRSSDRQGCGFGQRRDGRPPSAHTSSHSATTTATAAVVVMTTATGATTAVTTAARAALGAGGTGARCRSSSRSG